MGGDRRHRRGQEFVDVKRKTITYPDCFVAYPAWQHLSLSNQAKKVDLDVSRETPWHRPDVDVGIIFFWRTTPSSTKKKFSLKRRHRSGT
jgi:hypothetical protein